MTKHESLTRTCTACGIEKPLSAFMQLGGKQGTTYGSICATCRGTGITEKSTKPARDEERSSTGSSIRLGTKERVEIEKQQKLEQQNRQEIAEKETKKREQSTDNKLELLEQKEKTERAHREVYLEAKKKQSFLSNYQNRQLFNQQMISEFKKEDNTFVNAPVSNEAQLSAAELVKTEATKEQERITTLDLSGTPVLGQANYTVSRDNPIFNQFEKWLGETPLTKTKSRLYKSAPTTSTDSKATPSQEKDATDAPRDYINKTWNRSGKT